MNVKRKHIVVMISRLYSGTIKRVWASGFKSKICKRNNMRVCWVRVQRTLYLLQIEVPTSAGSILSLAVIKYLRQDSDTML